MKTLERTKIRAAEATSSARAKLPTSLRVKSKVSHKARAENRVRFAGLAFFIFVLGALFAVTLIQAQLVSPQQELDSLAEELVDLRAERSVLEHEVAVESAPERIIERAEELGLVPIPDLVPIEQVVSE